MQLSELYHPLAIRYKALNIPRTVTTYFIILTLVMLVRLIGSVNFSLGNSPSGVAECAANGLMTVLRDDKNLESLDAFGSKNGQNKEGTVAIQDYQSNWGEAIWGGKGLSALGGNVVFQDYEYGGATIRSGTLAMRLSGIPDEPGQKVRIQLQGEVMIEGIDQPVQMQLEFVSSKETYAVEQLTGKVDINGTITSL